MSMRPRTRTASTSTVETARGTHAFKVDRYSLHRGLGIGSFVRSATFGVGGYDWSIRFYPDGLPPWADYAAAFLELMSTDVAEVMASFDLRLVDQVTGQSTVLFDQGPKAFTSDVTKNPSAVSAWGLPKLKKRSELEASSSTFLRDDCLVG
jgi:speckle-type POZ protein